MLDQSQSSLVEASPLQVTLASVPDYKYRVFLSYSHADRKWGEWLYKRLDRYHVDETLVGHLTERGRVPNRLRPIFRDREGLTAGGTLQGKIEQALTSSGALVVICSKASARSRYVQHEIRTFKRGANNDRIFCFIVDGEPHDKSQECFPETLMKRFDADGNELGIDRPPIAADARAEGDGTALALSKLISGLLGVPLGSIWQRERQDQRRQLMMVWGVSAMTMLLAAGALSFGIAASRSQAKSEQLILNTLESTAAMVGTTTRINREYGVATEVSLGQLREADETLSRLRDISGDRPELIFRRAHLILSFSDLHGTLGDSNAQLRNAQTALALLQELADRPDGLRDRLLEQAGRAWRTLWGYDASGSDAVLRGLEAWKLRRDDLEAKLPQSLKRAYMTVGHSYVMQGRQNDAMEHFKRGLAIPHHASEKAVLSADDYIIDALLMLGISNVHRLQREYLEALEQTKSAISKLRGLKLDVRSTKGLQTLADAYLRAADLHRTIAVAMHGTVMPATSLSEAAAHIEEGLQLARRLHEEAPRVVSRGQMLAQGYMAQGDIRKLQGYHAAALSAYEHSRDIRLKLLDADPNNASVRNDLAYSWMKIGETRRDWPEGRDPVGSVRAYEQSIELFEQLRKLPNYTPARRNIWLALWGMEGSLERLGDNHRLLQVRRRKLEVAKEGDRLSPTSPQVRADLARSHRDLGEVLLRLGRTPEAEAELQAVLYLSKDHANWGASANALQLHRFHAYLGIGIVHNDRKEAGLALEALSSAHQLGNAILQRQPANIEVIRAQSEVSWQMTGAHTHTSRHHDALRTCRESVAFLGRLRSRSVDTVTSGLIADRASECDRRERAHAF